MFRLGNKQTMTKGLGTYDRIRTHVYEKYILPARNSGAASVVVVAGRVHDDLGYVDRIVLVCTL